MVKKAVLQSDIPDNDECQKILSAGTKNKNQEIKELEKKYANACSLKGYNPGDLYNLNDHHDVPRIRTILATYKPLWIVSITAILARIPFILGSRPEIKEVSQGIGQVAETISKTEAALNGLVVSFSSILLAIGTLFVLTGFSSGLMAAKNDDPEKLASGKKNIVAGILLVFTNIFIKLLVSTENSGNTINNTINISKILRTAWDIFNPITALYGIFAICFVGFILGIVTWYSCSGFNKDFIFINFVPKSIREKCSEIFTTKFEKVKKKFDRLYMSQRILRNMVKIKSIPNEIKSKLDYITKKHNSLNPDCTEYITVMAQSEIFYVENKEFWDNKFNDYLKTYKKDDKCLISLENNNL